jgi:hypothetical protein
VRISGGDRADRAGAPKYAADAASAGKGEQIPLGLTIVGSGFPFECPSGTLSAMNAPLTALERAFELAESGTCDSVTEIRKQLKSEGLPPDQIIGPTLIKQLRERIAASRKPS